jgi:hypothetical protein
MVNRMPPLVNETRLSLVAPLPGTPGSKATPAQVIALKNHVVALASHINQVKARMVMAQKALATLPAADVEAAVVTGYPPPT